LTLVNLDASSAMGPLSGQALALGYHRCAQHSGLPQRSDTDEINICNGAVARCGFRAAQDLRDRLKTEIDKWTPIIRKAGVYAD